MRMNNRHNKKNEIVAASIRSNQSIIVAVAKSIAINNPIIRRTETGIKFIDHEQVPRQSRHPGCLCHRRTYLSPNDDYFRCCNCNEIHYVKCKQSHFANIDEIHYSCFPILCLTCIFKINSLKGKQPSADKHATIYRR